MEISRRRPNGPIDASKDGEGKGAPRLQEQDRCSPSHTWEATATPPPVQGPCTLHPGLWRETRMWGSPSLTPAQALHRVRLFTKGFKSSKEESFNPERAWPRGRGPSSHLGKFPVASNNRKLSSPSLEVRSPKSRCGQGCDPFGGSRKDPSCLFQLWGLQASLGSWS